MCIDIVNIFRFHTCILKCELHGMFSTITFRIRSYNIISITGLPISYNFRINFCTAFFSMFIFLKNNNTGTFTHNKSVSVHIPRA